MKLKERNMPYERHEKGRKGNQGRAQTGFPQDALKQQVRSEAKEFKKSAGEALEAHDVEREIRHERIRTEAAHIAEQHQLKNDVEAEAKELKNLLSQNNKQ